ncbi:flippase [Methanolobus psychrotolerans]|uniref:flippase n=1 Tax=Methanolobus psychrotolerans TaxID=1874706 RepID=UPI000B91BB30|nr:flippase [Methanolobus psychrotolerans]
MTTARSVAKNTFFVAFSNIAAKIIAFIIAIYLARYLGVEDFGKYNFIITYLLLFGFIAGFGLDSVVIRDISKKPDEAGRIMSNASVIRILTSLTAIILAIITIHALKYPADTIFYIQLISAILLVQGLSYLFESLFQAKMKMEYAALSIIFPKIIFVIALYWIIRSNLGLKEILLAYLFSEFTRTIISFLYSKRILKYRLHIDRVTFKDLFRKSLPFVIGYGLLILYNRFDILMLSIMKGDLAVGYYAAAYKLTESVLFIPGALAATLMPVMARQFDINKEKLEYMYNLGVKYILMLILPISFGGVILGNEIIYMIYKEEFANSVMVFKILTFTIIFNSLISIQTVLLVAANKQQLNNISVSACAIINIILNLILIPQYSYVGAGIATLVSVVCLYIFGFYFIHRNLMIQPFRIDLFKYIVASIGMGLVIINVNMHLISQIITGAIVYALLVLMLKGFDREDMDMIKNLKGK